MNTDTVNYTDQLMLHCIRHWLYVAAYAYWAWDQANLDRATIDPCYLLFRGALTVPESYLELTEGLGLAEGKTVSLLQFSSGPELVFVDYDTDAEPGTLEHAARMPDHGPLTIAWEFAPGQIVWTTVYGDVDPSDADRSLKPPPTRADLN